MFFPVYWLNYLKSKLLAHKQWPGWAALLLLALLYSWTLSRDINSSVFEYSADSGEIQVALNLAGTIHFTGYPLYTMLSTVVTFLLRGVGMEPAMATSASSLLWSLLGLALGYHCLLLLRPGAYGVAAAGILLIGLVETVWVHSVITEVYSFSLLLFLLGFWLTLRLQRHWSWSSFAGLLLVLGSAVAHHRILGLMLPAFLLMLWPQLRRHWRSPRLLLFSLTLLPLPFLAYLYLPIRAWQGGWVYGQPGSWRGFWEQFTAAEVAYLLVAEPNWRVGLNQLLLGLRGQLPWPLLLGGLVGLIWLSWRQRWLGLGLLLALAANGAFVVVYPDAVFLPALLMPALLTLLLGLITAGAALAERHRVGIPLVSGLLILSAGWLFWHNHPLVSQLTGGEEAGIIRQALAPLADDPPLGQQTLAIPWGNDYFIAVYEHTITQRLGGFELVDHRADLGQILAEQGQILTLGRQLGNWDVAFWEGIAGQPLYPDAAAPGVIRLGLADAYREMPASVAFPLGNGVTIRHLDWRWLNDSQLQVSVYWQAEVNGLPDQSTTLFITRHLPPRGPEDLLAQQDAYHPLQGWYPLSRWRAGEVVRDDYLLELAEPAPSGEMTLGVGMYRQDNAGNFINSERFYMPLSGGE